MSEFVGINKKSSHAAPFALFNLAFRPFFLAAAILSIVSIGIWLLVYGFNLSIELSGLRSLDLHAHEMIYGYSLAVIAGFLLTAIMNWIGVQTVQGYKLALLVALWLAARILFLFGTTFLQLAAFFDLLFVACLILAVAFPIFKTKSWKQIGIIAKVLLLGLGNLCFYLGAFGFLEQGIYWATYGGLYIIVSLILTIGGRVMPAFVSNGVDYEIKIRSYPILLVLNLILFLALFVNELFFQQSQITAYLSFALFIINTIKLYTWHTLGIWRKPLLWSLFCAFLFINIGFLLLFLSVFAGVSKFLAIHSFAYGGIGMATIAMMSRVTLGHTGRSIAVPPPNIAWAFRILLLGCCFRIFVPLMTSSSYVLWIIISQTCWIIAFAIFLLIYAKMLVLSRVDGQPG